MTRRVWWWALPFVSALCGCFGSENKTVLVPTDPFGGKPVPKTAQVPRAPATEQVGLRVATVGRKILAANPDIGVEPAFTTFGSAKPEIFHRFSKDASQIWISEGLVRQSQTEGQLAALLCQELGKMVSEQQARVYSAARLAGRGLPQNVPVGNDLGGRFGPADGVHQAELGRFEKEHPDRPGPMPSTPPEPGVLARTYLRRADYSVTNLEAVAPLLRSAGENSSFEKRLTTALFGR